MKHYKYGGSTAERQLKCPGWQGQAAKIPKGSDQGSSYAMEGTMLHNVMEKILDNEIDQDVAQVLVGSVLDEVMFTEAHATLIEMALESFDKLCKQYQVDDALIETTFSISEEEGGTVDVMIWNDDVVIVVDWKFGQGIAVSPEKSSQGMFYAKQAEHELPNVMKGKKLVIAIIQPMPDRGFETLKTWEVPEKDFESFKRSHNRSMRADQTFLCAGDHCTFCPAAAICPKKTGEAAAALIYKPEDLEVLSENLAMAAKLKKWIAQVEKIGHQQAEDGAKVPGYKLVPKRATRKWLEPINAEAALRKIRKLKVTDFYPPATLISPTQAEKLFKAKNIDMGKISAYIKKQSTGTTLVPESDPRDAIPSATALIGLADKL